MDEIITIVIVVAAIAFKLVSKKLGSAGGDEVFPTIPVASDEQEHLDVADEIVIDEAEPALPVSPFVQKSIIRKTDDSVKPAKVKVETPILEEEQLEEKEREKVDPKKLVIYSEIMKPKYME